MVKAHCSNAVQECLTPKNIPFGSRIDNPPKLVQLRLYGLYLNERYMKTIGKQKKIDYLVKRIKQKAKELDQEMLQSMKDEAPSYATRRIIFSSLNMVFYFL